MTTLKEFFEIFITSLKKDQAFHHELTSKNYNETGLTIKFDKSTTQATLTIFLGGLSPNSPGYSLDETVSKSVSKTTSSSNVVIPTTELVCQQ